MTNDPLEIAIETFLKSKSITYTRPLNGSRTNLDFYLPDYDVFIEVKAWWTDRLARQVIENGDGRTIVLIGMKSVEAFIALCKSC